MIPGGLMAQRYVNMCRLIHGHGKGEVSDLPDQGANLHTTGQLLTLGICSFVQCCPH